jgi:hypothetical protein
MNILQKYWYKYLRYDGIPTSNIKLPYKSKILNRLNAICCRHHYKMDYEISYEDNKGITFKCVKCRYKTIINNLKIN